MNSNRGFLPLLLLVIFFSCFSVLFFPKTVSPTKKPIAVATPTQVRLINSYQLGLSNGTTLHLPDGGLFVVWHDWLFAGYGYYATQQVYAFNLTTGEVKKLFQNDNDRQGITDLALVNDRLIVSIGGYLAGGGMYTLNLPPDGKPAKLITESSNGTIFYQNGKYWIRGGEGDACQGGSYFDLLDPKTFKTTEIASDYSDCDGSGSLILALDYKSQVVMTEFVGNSDPSAVSSDNPSIPPLYQDLYLAPFKAPKQKVMLLTKKTMPAYISEISYDSSSSTVYLKGKLNYAYDLDKKQLKPIDVVPEISPTPSVDSSKVEFKNILQYLQKVPNIKITPEHVEL